MLGFGMALLCGFHEPMKCLGRVCADPAATVMQLSNLELSLLVTTPRFSHEQLKRSPVILGGQRVERLPGVRYGTSADNESCPGSQQKKSCNPMLHDHQHKSSSATRQRMCIHITVPYGVRMARQRRSHETSSRRRRRRIQGTSSERTSKPRGNIQKPRIGKNPSTPPMTSVAPTVLRIPALGWRRKAAIRSLINQMRPCARASDSGNRISMSSSICA